MARPIFGQPYRPDPEPAAMRASGPIIGRCTDPATTRAIYDRARPSAVSLAGQAETVLMRGTDGAPCYRCLADTGDGCHFLRGR